MSIDNHLVGDEQLTTGDKINKVIAELIEQCAILYPSNYEYVAHQLLVKKDLTVTSDKKLHDLLRQIEQLEQLSEDPDKDNPYIQLINSN